MRGDYYVVTPNCGRTHMYARESLGCARAPGPDIRVPGPVGPQTLFVPKMGAPPPF